MLSSSDKSNCDFINLAIMYCLLLSTNFAHKAIIKWKIHEVNNAFLPKSVQNFIFLKKLKIKEFKIHNAYMTKMINFTGTSTCIFITVSGSNIN